VAAAAMTHRQPPLVVSPSGALHAPGQGFLRLVLGDLLERVGDTVAQAGRVWSVCSDTHVLFQILDRRFQIEKSAFFIIKMFSSRFLFFKKYEIFNLKSAMNEVTQ
jgi:hypothetical protein